MYDPRALGTRLRGSRQPPRSSWAYPSVLPDAVLRSTDRPEMFTLPTVCTDDAVRQLAATRPPSPSRAFPLPVVLEGPCRARDACGDDFPDSFGIVLFRRLTGELPFDTGPTLSLFAHHLESKAPPPSWLLEEIHPGLEKIILAAMRKNPANRYASMREVLTDLECVLTGKGEVCGAPIVEQTRHAKYRRCARIGEWEVLSDTSPNAKPCTASRWEEKECTSCSWNFPRASRAPSPPRATRSTPEQARWHRRRFGYSTARMTASVLWKMTAPSTSQFSMPAELKSSTRNIRASTMFRALNKHEWNRGSSSGCSLNAAIDTPLPSDLFRRPRRNVPITVS